MSNHPNRKLNYALIVCDLNSSCLGEIRSRHKSREAAERALGKLGNTLESRGAYVATRMPDGKWPHRAVAQCYDESGGSWEAVKLTFG